MTKVILIQDKFDKSLWHEWSVFMALEGVFTYKFLYSNGEESKEYQRGNNDKINRLSCVR